MTQSKYALLVVFQGVMVSVALLLQLTVLTQPLFLIRYVGMGYVVNSATTTMGYEDMGLLYFIPFLVLIALTAFIVITRSKWRNALRSTPLLAYTIVFSMILLMLSFLLNLQRVTYLNPISTSSAYTFYKPLEGFYTFCLSYVLLAAGQALGPPIATQELSFRLP